MKGDEYHNVSIVVVLILVRGLLANGNGDAAKYTAMYVFGDSLTDPGNNKYFVDSTAKADYLPYGMDFSEGPTGRFCNGKLLVDFLAEMVGLPILPSYADVVAKGVSTVAGVNYASAGAGILGDTGYRFGRVVPLSQQIHNLKKTVDELQMQENEVSNYLARALVFLDIGANDYLNNYLQPDYYPSSRIYNATQFVDLLVNRYTDHILEIRSIGLRKFIISDASPIGCGPLRIQNKACDDSLNKMVGMFNMRLKPLVHHLNSNYPASKFIYAPSFQVFTQLFHNAAAYGFKVKDKACCGEKGNGKGTKPLCFKDTEPCPNRDEYLFWDAAHPSEAANRILAHLIYNATL